MALSGLTGSRLHIMRGLQALFSIIVLGLMAYVIHKMNNAVYVDPYTGYYSYISVNFGEYDYLLFAALWTLLVVAFVYIATMAMSKTAVANPIVLLVVDALTMVFWFSAFIAAAVVTGTCSGDCGTVYGSAAAAVAFGAFTWAITLAIVIMSVMGIISAKKARSNNVNMTSQTAPVAVDPATGAPVATKEQIPPQDYAPQTYPAAGYQAPPPVQAQYTGTPPPQGVYQQPPPEGGYQSPPLQGGYAPPPQGEYAPPVDGGYGAPPPQAGYQAAPVQDQYAPPQQDGYYQPQPTTYAPPQAQPPYPAGETPPPPQQTHPTYPSNPTEVP